MGRARNPLSLAHHLGLTKHPTLQGIHQGHKVGRYNLMKTLRDIVYRVEHVGQHLDVEAARKQHDQHKARGRRERDKLLPKKELVFSTVVDRFFLGLFSGMLR